MAPKRKNSDRRGLVNHDQQPGGNVVPIPSNLESEGAQSVLNIQSFCRIKIFKSITSGLSDAHKARIRAVGFGGLLLANFATPRHDMNRWIISCYDTTSYTFEVDKHKSFVVTAADVHDVFCLPRNVGNPVPRYSHHVAVDEIEYRQVRSLYKMELGVTDDKFVSLTALEGKVKSFDEPTDDFIRWFILAAYTMLLDPTSNFKIDFRILKAVQDLNDLVNYDWCQLVFDNIRCGIDKCVEEGKDTVAGPFYILQVIYFQHVTFQDSLPFTTIPLIQHWDGVKINTRIRLEGRARSYGSGVVHQQCICTKTVCKNHIVEALGDSVLTSGTLNRNQPSDPQQPSTSTTPNQGLGTALRSLINTIQRMISPSIDNFDTDVETTVTTYTELVATVHGTMLPIVLSKLQRSSDDLSCMSDSQFFADPCILAQIDRIVHDSVNARHEIQNTAVFKAASTQPGTTRPPSSSGTEDDSSSDNGDGLDTIVDRVVSSITAKPPSSAMKSNTKGKLPISCEMQQNTSLAAGKNVVGPSFDVSPACFSRSSIKRNEDLSFSHDTVPIDKDKFEFFSKFGRKYKSLWKRHMQLAELEALDWIFYTNKDFVANHLCEDEDFEPSSPLLNMLTLVMLLVLPKKIS